MTKTESLLPCPYCGRGDTLRYGCSSEFHEYCDTPLDSDEHFAVFCDASKPNGLGGCGASAGFARTHEEAAALWNRRPAPEPKAKPAPHEPVWHIRGARDCEKCHGAGWLYGRELEEADEDTRLDTMTKYTCDGEKCVVLNRGR